MAEIAGVSADGHENAKYLGDSVHAESVQLTLNRKSGNRRLKWNSIVRALKGLKTKIHHGNEDVDIPYADEADEGVASVSAEWSGEGVSSPGNVSPKESVDLTDNEDLVRGNKDGEDEVKHEPISIVKTTEHAASTPKRQHRMAAEDDVIVRSENESDSKTRGVSEVLKNNLAIILSGIYGIMIVVMGLVLPLSEIFVNSDHPYFFEVFYLYLYSVSMVFLVYVYTYLLRKERLFSLNLPRTISRTLTRTLSRTSLRSTVSEKCVNPAKPLVRYNSTLSSISQRRRKKVAYNPDVSAHTGSFYLRVGLVGFGIGSMIHSGLTFGHYFEISHFANHCSDAVQAIKPFALLCFTFVQMYFIFMNSKMCIYKYKTLARFGLMHMSCTNICVWLRSLVIETLLVMKINERETFNAIVQTSDEELRDTEGAGGLELGSTHSPEELSNEDETAFITEFSCNLDAMMGKVVESSSVYLYPCTIDYSLVCACVLYVMWSNVGVGSTSSKSDSCSDIGGLDSEDDSEDDNPNHRMSVDCAGSSKGLFLGILLFVVSVVCVVCFYVLTSASTHVTTGTLVGHICEEIILIITFVATAIGSYQMREMNFAADQKVGIEEILTLISVSGLGLYGAWSITAALFYLDTLHGRLTIITNLFMLVQAGSQATFTLVALRASARTTEQLRTKPGRQCVTFLLICNFALWVINTFETQRLEHNQTQVDFYGTTAWSIFSHVSVPLGIYFRFHSTVNLSIVWKKAWKKKEVQHGTRVHGHH